MAIESEEKCKRLAGEIKHWCDRVKATPLLREGDIEGLVETIIDEFYHIRLCCGHYVREFDEGVALEFEDYTGDGGTGTVYGMYCADCAKRYKKKLKAREIKWGQCEKNAAKTR